jgi:hypothetical protein
VRARARNSGVVLVDAIVGAILVAVALAVMLGLAGRSIATQADGERLRVAAMLLDEQLQLVLARGPDAYASRFGLTGVCEEPFTGYRWQLRFEGGTGGSPYTVTATIGWSEISGRERSESVATLVAPRLGDEPDPERRPDEPVERWP